MHVEIINFHTLLQLLYIHTHTYYIRIAELDQPRLGRTVTEQTNFHRVL